MGSPGNGEDKMKPKNPFTIGEHGPEELTPTLDCGLISSAYLVASVSLEFERSLIDAYSMRCEYCGRLQINSIDGVCVGCGAPL